jgi:hypothetical protein
LISDGVVDDVPLTPAFAPPLLAAVPPAVLLVPFPAAPWFDPTLAETPVLSLPTVAWCPVAVTDVDVPETQLVPSAPANTGCPLRATAVPAPAKANAATEAIMVVRYDFIGSSLMGSGVSEPFNDFIAH